MTIFKGLFGGNDDAKKQAADAEALQAVSNDRQIAELNKNDALIGATRRAPRGRRLFEDGPDAGQAATSKTLGTA
jgi:hypothetical protein